MIGEKPPKRANERVDEPSESSSDLFSLFEQVQVDDSIDFDGTGTATDPIEQELVPVSTPVDLDDNVEKRIEEELARLFTNYHFTLDQGQTMPDALADEIIEMLQKTLPLGLEVEETNTFFVDSLDLGITCNKSTKAKSISAFCRKFIRFKDDPITAFYRKIINALVNQNGSSSIDEAADSEIDAPQQ